MSLFFIGASCGRDEVLRWVSGLVCVRVTSFRNLLRDKLVECEDDVDAVDVDISSFGFKEDLLFFIVKLSLFCLDDSTHYGKKVEMGTLHICFIN